MRKKIVLLLTLVLGLSSTNAAAQRRYKVTVDSMPSGAAVYLETKEADPVGTTPHSFRLKRGKYTFFLQLAGYEPFSRTVDIRRSGSYTFTLKKLPEPATFSIEPAAGSQAAGAEVKINGKAVGKIPISVKLHAGRYLVEVTKDGFLDWRKWIDVQQSENRSLVVTLVSRKPNTGRVLVTTNVSTSEVFVDGKSSGKAPALAENVTVGKHQVEVRADGYLPARKEIMVEGGQTVRLTIQLEPDEKTVAAAGGTLQVLTEPSGAEVLVDGQSNGPAPVKVQGLADGTHLVEAKMEGYVTGELSVETQKGLFRTVKLKLKAKEEPKRTGAISVSTTVEGAKVFVDGKEVGAAPQLVSELDPGPHMIKVSAEGYSELLETVEVKAGETAEVKAELTASEAKPATDKAGDDKAADKAGDDKAADKAGDDKATDDDDEAPQEREPFGLSSYGAQLVGVKNFTADVSLGFPHIFEGRLTVGAWQHKWFGLDAGIEFRTYGHVTEIGAHANFRLFHRDPFAVAFFFNIGGGGGPASRNTFYTNLGLSFSIWFKRMVTFTGRFYANIYSDRLCPEDSADDDDDVAICKPPEPGVTDPFERYRDDLPSTNQEMRERFVGGRFFLEAILEVPIHERVNIFALVRGAPGQAQRWAFRDVFASLMPEDDPRIYGRAGVTFKF